MASHHITFRAPADLHQRFVGHLARTRRSATEELVQALGAHLDACARESESDLVWELVNSLSDDPAEKPSVTFDVSHDGQVSTAIEPDHGTPLEQHVEVVLRPNGALELHGHAPDFDGVTVPVATLPVRTAARLTVRLEDLDPQLRL